MSAVKTIEAKYINLILVGIFLCLIVLTFPIYDPYFDKGVDGPLPWVFNYYFDLGLDPLQYTIFPHGPLAFLLYPLPIGNNLFYAFLLDFLLKLVVFLNIYTITKNNTTIHKLGALIVLLLLFLVCNIQQLILLSLISSYVRYYRFKNNLVLYFCVTLTALAVFIKAYVAITSCLLAFSFLVVDFYRNKELNRIVGFLLGGVLLTTLIWYGLLGFKYNIIQFFLGMKELASDNSVAVAYYPQNNWILLTLFIVIVCVIPFVINRVLSYKYFGLLILPFFAAWKHGMARQDIYHSQGLLVFALIYFGLYYIVAERRKWIVLFLSILGLIVFYSNHTNVINYKPYQISFNRMPYFCEFVFDYSGLLSKYNKKSSENIESSKLSKEVIDLIGREPVDVFPWDYSIIVANNLNWQPRPVLHSYASYTSWLDEFNATHYKSDKSPKYIIWDNNAVNHSSLASVDNRYLLNDEPKTILTILSNYEVILKNDQITLFKQRESQLYFDSELSQKHNLEWMNWVEVPKSIIDPSKEILRAKLVFDRNLLGDLKSILYKDESVYVYYKRCDGTILFNRIVPRNATDGIWIMPYLSTWNSSHEICEIMFRSSDSRIMNNEIELVWDKVSSSHDFLNSEAVNNKSIFAYEGSSELDDTVWQRKNELSHSEYVSSPTSEKMTGKYSTTFSYYLNKTDNYLNRPFEVEVSFWMKSHQNTSLNVVASIENANGEHIKWQSEKVYQYDFFQEDWNSVNKRFEFLPSEIKDATKLVVYVWKDSEEPVFIDDLIVVF